MREIARVMDRSVSTISDEIQRNSVKGIYTPIKAQHKAYARRRNAKYQGKKIVDNHQLREFVEHHLLNGNSPEAIAARLRKGYDGLPYASRDTIETYIASPYGRQLEYRLAQMRKVYKKRRKKRVKTGSLGDGRKNIIERPIEANERQRIGDTEADFIVSGKDGEGYLLTVVDRRCRIGYIRKIYPVTIANMEKAFLEVLEVFPWLLTITTDNDLLFQHHERLEELLGVPIYFCDPYSSWQKGTVERYNREVRKYIPKGSNILLYDTQYIQWIEDRLNNRFMGVLDSKTPCEYLTEDIGDDPIQIPPQKN